MDQVETKKAEAVRIDEGPGDDLAGGTPEPVVERDVSGDLFVERFDGFSRFLHVLVIISFLALAVTGMTIKFSDVAVFQWVSRLTGGYEVSGFIHRLAAIITFGYFGLHLGYLFRRKKDSGASLREMLTGEDTLWFRKRDLIEFGQSLRWFVGRGPRPNYGKWTYWEKFDYFAVFWGVVVIGLSGLLLWFPEFFTRLGVPGFWINIATIIHSDEALLAAGFIFTIHFFNTHFRPDRFPMDPVIFTGRVSLEEMKRERPREYQLLEESGQLEKMLVDAPPRWMLRWAHVFGLTALAIGIITVILIIYSVIFVGH